MHSITKKSSVYPSILFIPRFNTTTYGKRAFKKHVAAPRKWNNLPGKKSIMVRSARLGVCVCGIKIGITHSKPCGINTAGFTVFYTNFNSLDANAKSRWTHHYTGSSFEKRNYNLFVFKAIQLLVTTFLYCRIIAIISCSNCRRNMNWNIECV